MNGEHSTFTGRPVTRGDAVHASVRRAMDAGDGVLRLAPNWVPRSFLHPGKRLRLHPDDLYAYGGHRGGIDERWLGSTVIATNENRVWHEGLSFVCHGDRRFLLSEAIEACGEQIVGRAIFDKYRRWPIFAKFFDNMGPIPHHMHQRNADAARVGQEGKPESYYFPPQLNSVGNNFPYAFFGLSPGTTKAEVRRCLERWSRGDNGILDLSSAYRLKSGTGWLIPPGVLHAPGSLCTYEPQWGSDVFSMFQSMVENRIIPWELLVKDMPAEKHHDLDFIIGQLDWGKNVDPQFKTHNYLEPITAAAGDGWVDRWVVFGLIDGEQLFSARELTVDPDARCQLKDPGASSLIAVQGFGRIGKLRLESPAMIRFDRDTEDEVFITAEAAAAGIEIENIGAQPLVSLRYFGPDTFEDLPNVGDHALTNPST
jgi:hypothetical protein